MKMIKIQHHNNRESMGWRRHTEFTYDIPKTGNKHLHTSKKGLVSIFPSSDLTRANSSKAGLNTDDPPILLLPVNENILAIIIT